MSARRDRGLRRRRAVLRAEQLEPRRLLALTPLVIRGDADPAAPDDVIVVEPDPAAPRRMQFTVNGTVVARRAAALPGLVVINGGAGNDVIRVDVPWRLSMFVIRGGDGDDHLSVRGAGPTVMAGNDGDDTLVGGRGADRLLGGVGEDLLAGGGGRNVLIGGLDADHVLGRRPLDRIVAGVDDIVEETRQDNPLVRAGSLDVVGRWLASGTTRSATAAVARGFVSAFSGMAREMAGIATTALATTAGDHSGTNNQIAGVEEGDLVQTDGRFIYLVSDGTLRIIDAGVDTLTVVAERPVAGDAGELFLHGDRLTIISTVWDTTDDVVVPLPEPVIDPDTEEDASSPVDEPDQLAVMVMPFPFTGWNTEVRVTVLDVTDRAAPVVVEEMNLDGTLLAARAIDDRIHLVVDAGSPLAMPFGGGFFEVMPMVRPAEMARPALGWGGTTGAAVEAGVWGGSGSSAFAWPGDGMGGRPVPPRPADIVAALPRVRVTPRDGETTESPLVDPGAIHLPLGGGGDGGLITIATFSPVDDTPGIDHTVTTLGLGGIVQASIDTLVIASTDFDAAFRPITTLNTFALGETVTHVATGTVPGWVPDQFAIDADADGLLRVVAHEGFARTAATVVHVLESQGLDLTSIGRLGRIAPGEDLKAVRFLGDIAYVVTFEEVDPLFAIDLADPRRPRVAGELKIPGFSSYLQEMEPGRLFGIGRGDDPGTAKLSLFDIADISAPSEVDSITIGGGDGWSASEASTEHRAFGWFPEQGVLAVPYSEWSWDGVTSAFDTGLRVFGVDREAGFTQLADVRHEAPIRRSLRIGETLFSVSSAGITAHDLADGLRTVASLDFT
jgi:hypothetical protein